MTTRRRKQFVYEGFGFPVVLKNVPMVRARGTWTPKVDFNSLARRLIQALATHPSRLTGQEVRFVRHYFELTLERFAARFGVSHPAVVKWEKAGSAPANMSWGTEKDLRLFMLDSLGVKPKQFAETYRQLARPMSARARRLTMDVAA